MTERIAIGLLAIALSACGGAPTDPPLDPLQCGAGTMLIGSECIVTVTTCDPGTHDEGGTCVPDTARYELHITETTLGANGHTRRKVMAFGTAADGTPLDDDIVLGLDRASAGSYDETAVTLAPLGATTYFTPCDGASSDCLGPATLTLALASAPATVLAHVEVMIVPSEDVSTVAPCSAGGNMFYIDGNDYIRNGMVTVEDPNDYVDGTADEVEVYVTPTDPTQGLSWTVRLDTIDLGVPLTAGIYDADRYHTSTPGLAGLDVSGNGHGCGTVTGRFHLYDYTMVGSEVMSITASFEQHCDGMPELLEGCVHYEAP